MNRRNRSIRIATPSVLRWTLTVFIGLALSLGGGTGSLHPAAEGAQSNPWLLIGLGDSLTHGTMDATNNYAATWYAYLQRVANSLGQRIPVVFSQPWFGFDESRLLPMQFPTNLGVDGADAFSMEGLEYYQRAGASESVLSGGLLADVTDAGQLKDKYDKVIYPINTYTGGSASQVDAAVWLLSQGAPAVGIPKALTVLWIGNNDSSTAALGTGGSNPVFFPVPVEQIATKAPLLSFLLAAGRDLGILSLNPYTQPNIERNLTRFADFAVQYDRILNRLQTEGAQGGVEQHLFLLTLPYYSAIGYLFDSEDLEFYLRKVNPAYTVPASFARVAPAGQPITDPFKGDRVSLLTFGLMYALLSTGSSVAQVNQVLDTGDQQRDGLVLSEAEQRYIMSRIDYFNWFITASAVSRGPNVHLVDVGTYLNDALSGKTPVRIGGRTLSRKWIRGGGFTFDGVHPSYTGQAFIANYVIGRINQALGLDAPSENLDTVFATDPYIDRDGDGWAAGPPYDGAGITDLLFLFKDPNDTSSTAQPVLPSNVWDRITNAILGEVLGVPAMQAQAARFGVAPLQRAVPTK